MPHRIKVIRIYQWKLILVKHNNNMYIDIIDKIEEQIINKKPKIRIQSPIISMLNIDKKIQKVTN